MKEEISEMVGKLSTIENQLLTMDNKPVKIDVIGTIESTISDLIRRIGFTILVCMILGCLVAPWFTCFFRPLLDEKYNTNHHPENYKKVKQELKKINMVLWGIAIVSWIILIVSNIKYGIIKI